MKALIMSFHDLIPKVLKIMDYEQISKELLEARKKTWDNLFDKYSNEISNGIKLCTDASRSEEDEGEKAVSKDEYSWGRVPMHKPAMLVQYWINTSDSPYKLLLDGTELSEIDSSPSEKKVPSPSGSPVTYAINATNTDSDRGEVLEVGFQEKEVSKNVAHEIIANDTRVFRRKRLYTGRESPVDLVPTEIHGKSRLFEARQSLHPALDLDSTIKRELTLIPKGKNKHLLSAKRSLDSKEKQERRKKRT